jgi:hypothetical protein
MVGFFSHIARGWWALAIAAALAPPAGAVGQNLTERILVDARDGSLDDFDFAVAALIASGVEEQSELAGWIRDYDEKRARLLATISNGPIDDKLQAMHAALHEQWLTGIYRTNASDLRLTFVRGDFNCLTALAIYFDVCRAAGIDLDIWLQRGHVCLRRTAAEGAWLIEPGATRWTCHRFSRENEGRQITPLQLLGKFYYNRGVELLESRRFSAGLVLLQNSLALDADDGDARLNLAAGFNNWAVEQCRAKRYASAAALIAEGLALDPLFAPLVANRRLVTARLGD